MLEDVFREWQLAELAAADAELRASRAVEAAERQLLGEQAQALRILANEALDRLLDRYRTVRPPSAGPDTATAPRPRTR